MGPGFRPDDVKLQNKPAEVRVLGEIADMLLNIVGVDLNGFAMAVGRGEGNLVEHALYLCWSELRR